MFGQYLRYERDNKRNTKGKFDVITGELLKDISIEDNPVLMFYKLKDF